MKIGIDASRAFLKNRTGIEEYSYRVIDGLKNNLQNEQVVLYVRKTDNLQLTTDNGNTKINELELPANWSVKVIKWPRFWTQIGLSLELLLHPIDALFVPAHTVPIFHPARNATRFFNNAFIWQVRKLFNSKEEWKYMHSVAGGPKKTVVVVHGLEYEFCPEAYSFLEKFYMRWTIKKSCQWASKIISVSENTKRDLINLYNVPAEKITVIYEGYADGNQQLVTRNQLHGNQQLVTSYQLLVTSYCPYLLFVGRIEQRKNISNVVEAFNLLKERSDIEHKLVLAGRPGYGYEDIKLKIENSKFKKDIIELGYISEEEKWQLFKKADVFVFATFYEGFGIPILEAQSAGCPVVASNNSSIPEVANDSALLVDPMSHEDIAGNIYKLLSDKDFKDAIIQKGLENVKRFSWEKCAQEIANEIIK